MAGMKVRQELTWEDNETNRCIPGRPYTRAVLPAWRSRAVTMEAGTPDSPATGADGAAKIWAVGSGKGGVGKSFITANLGVAMAKHGKHVVLVDLDLGGANLHTCLGMAHPERTLSDFLTGKVEHINDLLEDTCVPGLNLISGAADSLHIANLKYFQKTKVIRNLSRIEADYVILDLGAGTTFNTLDFFVHAKRGLVSVIPEPTSIENTYRFLKCVYMRKLRTTSPELQHIVQDVLIQKHRGGRKIKTLAAFFSAMDKLHPEHSASLKEQLGTLRLHLIVNQVHESADIEMGQSLKLACQKYFGMALDYAGYLYHDASVVKALRQYKPFLFAYPHTRLAINFDHIAASMIERDAA